MKKKHLPLVYLSAHETHAGFDSKIPNNRVAVKYGLTKYTELARILNTIDKPQKVLGWISAYKFTENSQNTQEKEKKTFNLSILITKSLSSIPNEKIWKIKSLTLYAQDYIIKSCLKNNFIVIMSKY